MQIETRMKEWSVDNTSKPWGVKEQNLTSKPLSRQLLQSRQTAAHNAEKKEKRKRMEEHKPLDQALANCAIGKGESSKTVEVKDKTKIDLWSISDCTETGEEKRRTPPN